MQVTSNILTLYFNRGAKVKGKTVVHVLGETRQVETIGHVECERTDRPGHYYVRREDTKTLMSVLWLDMELTA